MPVYSYTDLKESVRDISHGQLDNLAYPRQVINRAVRQVSNDVDLRSAKRVTPLSPALMDDIYSYTKPADLKRNGFIDLIPRSNNEQEWSYIEPSRRWFDEWVFTLPDYFHRMKERDQRLVAVRDADFIGRLLVAANIDSEKTIIHSMESTDNWSGSNVNDIELEKFNYVEGSAALQFDVGTADTTPYIENSNIEAVDLSDYVGKQIFLKLYIPSAGLSKVNSIELRWGNDSSNYYQQTVSKTNENTALMAGYNVLRFDWDDTISTTGSPDASSIKYVRITINLSGTYTNDVDNWVADALIARAGIPYDLYYYSKYMWQSASGTYKENSDADDDVLNVDTDEVDLIGEYVTYLTERAVKSEVNARDEAFKMYKASRDQYQLNSPSEAKPVVTYYYEF